MRNAGPSLESRLLATHVSAPHSAFNSLLASHPDSAFLLRSPQRVEIPDPGSRSFELRPILELHIEFSVPRIQRHRPPIDEQVLRVRPRLENVAGRHHDLRSEER